MNEPFYVILFFNTKLLRAMHRMFDELPQNVLI